MRRVIAVLRPTKTGPELAPQRGIDDLDVLATHIRSTGIDVSVQFEGERRHVPAALNLSVYRIAQEALTNTVKHAGASRAVIAVRYADDAIELECNDNGVGAAASSNGDTGHGLVGMRERALMLGGELIVGPHHDGGGYRVHARLPLDPLT
jgi:signal transduction histidine kinase